MDNAYTAGKKLLCGGYSEYTPTGKSYFVKNGRWGTVPKKGAVVYFYSTSLGRVAHVGIVGSVNTANKTFKTAAEGNTSSTEYTRNGGCVAQHEYSYANVGGTNRVNGFGYPVFGDDTCTVDEFIAAANAEIGYLEKRIAGHEGATDRAATAIEKSQYAGDNNYTKYGLWYSDNGVYWCQQYVSWVAYIACKNHQAEAKTGWSQLADGRWVYHLYGVQVSGQWLQIGGWWYVFGCDGIMMTGWYGSNETGWYYLDPDTGVMMDERWFKVKDIWYYATKDGETAKNVYVKSTQPGVYCWLGEDGSWEPKWDTTEPDLKKYGLAE